MTISGLSRRALSMIILAVLGFTLAFSLPVVSQEIMTTDDMSDIDLIEMVCDWTAIAQELGDNGGSARQWADRTIGYREHFNFGEVKKQFIYRVIDDLDRQVVFFNKGSIK